MSQLEKLVDYMDTRRWLATGHARTANARNKSREAWTDIAHALNSDGSGCVKEWQQWCKYWKDKKGAVKRKANAIAVARRRTGGGLDEVPEMSLIEQKILALMGGESFATGDRHLEINPFHENNLPIATSDENTGGNNDNDQQQSDSILQSSIMVFDEDNINIDAVSSQLDPTHMVPDNARHSADETVTIESTNVQTEPPPPPLLHPENTTPIRRGRITQSVRRSPRAAGSAARRRLLRRSPPSQRHSQMASLTDRFVAIEERRAEAECRHAEAQQLVADAYSQALREVARSFVEGQQSIAQSIGLFAQSINKLADAVSTRSTNPH